MPVSFNPLQTTNAGGSFNVSSLGFIQGTALDSPNARFNLAGGILAATEMLPMWGGIAINELITPGITGNPGAETGFNRALGGQIARAVAAGPLIGFSVFDQASAMINWPQSPVPTAQPGMGVNFYRVGSGSRLVVAMDPSLVSLEGATVSSPVSWDFVNQRLAPYNAAWASVGISNAVYSSVANTYTFTTASPHGIGVGVDISISGVVPSAYNGSFQTVGGTTASTIVVASSAAPTAYSSGGTVAAGGGALPCSVLETSVGNSMVVAWDNTNLVATWNRSGSAAVILI